MRYLFLAALLSLAQAESVDPSYLKLLEWRSVGPARGGRVEAVAGDPVNRFVFYMGATGGGVWKTDDGGITWRNVSDGFFKTGSVGAIAVAPSNPNVVYAGMGESCFRGDTSHGDGVYKTTDGGSTWKNIGLAPTRHIARIRIHPSNPDMVYVAAFGDGFGPSADRGVYRSSDGGATWKKILYRTPDAGAIDLVLDEHDPKVLYASLLDFRRFPWGLRSGGPGTALFKSADGGDTWKDLTGNPGMPPGLKGRIGIAQSPVKPERVWAIVDAAEGKKGVFRTDDGGATWTRVSDNAELTQRPWYYHHIFADTKDADTVYVLNIGMWKSTDGGKTYQQMQPPHGDNHDLWIDPKDPMRMIEGDDGGATVSFNGGRSWSTLYNQPTAQFYHVVTDNQWPYRVYGPQQDNSSLSIPSRSDFGRITNEEAYSYGNSESGYAAVNIKDPNIIYFGDHHWLYRHDHRTNQTRDISPNPETWYGWGARDINFRFQWTYPVMTSPHDPKVIYATSQFVHRSINEGQSWDIISPDLTRHDPSKLEKTPSYNDEKIGDYWGPVTRDNAGVEWYSVIFAFAESPARKDLLWAGSDDGYVQVSQDGGKSWSNVTPKGLPEFSLISIIDPSPHDPAACYIAATRYKLQDRHPYLFKTSDYGRTWTRISNGIPEDDFTRVIREDPGRRGLLYAGTETGIYGSFDDGAQWQPLQLNLPAVPVHDLVVHRSADGLTHDLVAATHGRGFWILDNAGMLGQIADLKTRDAVTVFMPAPAVRERISNSHVENFGGGAAAGQNPPPGVVIPYYLREKPNSPVTISIADPNGGMIRTFSSEAAMAAEGGTRRGRAAPQGRVTANQGANRFVWNMLYPPARVNPGTVLHGPPFAPTAASGTYKVTVKVDGQSATQNFKIVTDPRVQYSDGQLAEQFSFLMAVRDLITQTHDVVRTIREARKQAEAWAGTSPQRQAELKALNDKLYAIEERLTQYRAHATQNLTNYPVGIDDKLTQLASLNSMADGPPTQQSYTRFQELSKTVAERRATLDAILAEWKVKHP
ncbi:MAG: glycosyl hydrolase [Acidobacteria bacterium]|nr:MAG: glycosyl hydrolase [Acidobacteriota bacterium]